MSNIVKVFNGQNVRSRRLDDGSIQISLTDIAKATGKVVNEWTRLPSANDYIDRYSRITGKSRVTLITSIRGNSPNRGTWADRKIAIRFAQWADQDFAIQVDLWIEELLTTGHVDLSNSIDQSTGEWKELERQNLELQDRLEKVEHQLDWAINYNTSDWDRLNKLVGILLIATEDVGYRRKIFNKIKKIGVQGMMMEEKGLE